MSYTLQLIRLIWTDQIKVYDVLGVYKKEGTMTQAAWQSSKELILFQVTLENNTALWQSRLPATVLSKKNL